MLGELHVPRNIAKPAPTDRNRITRAGTLWVDLGHGVAFDAAPVPICIRDAIQDGLTDTNLTARHLTTVALAATDTPDIFKHIVEVPL